MCCMFRPLVFCFWKTAGAVEIWIVHIYLHHSVVTDIWVDRVLSLAVNSLVPVALVSVFAIQFVLFGDCMIWADLSELINSDLNTVKSLCQIRRFWHRLLPVWVFSILNLTFSLFQFLPCRQHGCKVLPVGVSVCVSTSISQKRRSSFKNFLYMLPVSMAWFSSDDSAIRDVFTVLWMTSYLPVICEAKAMLIALVGCIIIVTHQIVRGRTGAKSYVYDWLVCNRGKVSYISHEWVLAKAKCILLTADCVRVCVCVCLSVALRIPTLLHGPRWNPWER